MKNDVPRRPVDPRLPVDNETLDRVIDETLQAMTAVDAVEAGSRARALARLAASERRATTSPDSSPWWTPRQLSPWAALGAASVVAVLVFLVLGRAWPDGRPAPAPQQAAHDVNRAPRGESSRSPAPDAPAGATPSPVTTPAPLVKPAPGRAVAPRAAAPRPRELQRVRPRPTPSPDDRLAYVMRAIQQLPPDAWERLDSVAPPVTPELAPTGPAPIAPLSVDELPRSDFFASPSTVTSPGEPR